MKKIAVTGGIGSGKSTVLSILKENGYPVFSCDEIYKNLLYDREYIEKLQKIFPSAVKCGAIDKRVLSTIVFKDKNAREQLNATAHPLIMARLYENMQNCTTALAFAEVPLLFEGDYVANFDGVLVVLRSKEKRVSAIMQRDTLSKEEAERRIAVQFDYDSPSAQELFSRPNVFPLRNEGNKSELKKKINEILRYL